MKAKSPALELETRNSERETVSWKRLLIVNVINCLRSRPYKEFEI